MKTTEEIDIWKMATAFAGHYGAIPSSFSSLIRGLNQDTQRNNDCIGEHHQSAMLRFLRAPSMLSPFYFYIKTFKPQLLTGSALKHSDLLNGFKAGELAAFLSVLYLYRKTRKLIEDPTEWEIVSNYCKQNSEIGALVGYRLNQIEPEIGLLVGSIRFLTWASLLAKDLKSYQEYRRHLKKHRIVSDANYEIKTFGCSTAAVAANLLIVMGYSREMAISFAEGMLCEELPDRQTKPGEYAIVLTELWIDSLLKNQTPPSIHDDYSFAIDEKCLADLVLETQPAREKFSCYDWLDKGKQDLTLESAPELFNIDQTVKNTSSQVSSEKSSQEELLDELEQLG